MRERVQHAALLIVLSPSPKHLTTESIAPAASGLPIFPNYSKAIYLIFTDLFLSYPTRTRTTSSLIAAFSSYYKSSTCVSMLKCREDPLLLYL